MHIIYKMSYTFTISIKHDKWCKRTKKVKKGFRLCCSYHVLNFRTYLISDIDKCVIEVDGNYQEITGTQQIIAIQSYSKLQAVLT